MADDLGANVDWDDVRAASPRWRRRQPYFERPKPPHDWRFWVGGIGKTLITIGVLLFLFVGYQLWGTGIQTARAQDSLEDEFRNALQSTTTQSTATTVTQPITTDTVVTSTTVAPPPVTPAPQNGEPVARLEIDRIGLDVYVVEGVRTDDLKKGPGHFRETPMPGELGNAAIAGHRTTYGAPFLEVDQLEEGDLIKVTTLAGTFAYSVTGTEIVEPGDYALVIPTKDPTMATLTLVSCHPAYTARQRIVVSSVLVPEQSDPIVTAPPTTVTPEPAPTDTLPSEEPATTIPSQTPTTSVTEPLPLEDAFSEGWFADRSAIPQSIGWAMVLAVITIGAYFVGKRARRLYVSFLVGFVPVIVALYFFFLNVNRLLPPSL